MTKSNNKIAEVIEAGTAQFAAQCYELYEIPPLGSLVRTGDIYGIVAGASTASLEPNRRPIARGKDEASEEAVYQASPQLLKLLRSEFEAVVIGYRDGESIRRHLPPRPARIHGFVYLCQPDEAREFARGLDFLPVLLGAALPVPCEELIAAALREMARAQEDPRAFLVAAGKELASLLSGDFVRLKNILGRIQ
jgi:hypothetical protein